MAKARDSIPPETGVGLCASCAHAVRQESARGARFWRCLRAEHDPRFRRYPSLPVLRCSGHEPGAPQPGVGSGEPPSPC